MMPSTNPPMTAGEFLEEYIESLENLPSEVQQGLQELGKQDAEYFELRESYRTHWKRYIKSAKRSTIPVSEDPALVAARLNIEKEYMAAIRKVDQKIENSAKLYELINRQIVRLDEETQRLGIDLQDPGEVKKAAHLDTPTATRDRKSQKGPISAPRSSPSGRKRGSGAIAMDIDPNEPLYCFCQQVSFGDMVGCDNDSCDKEWFHYGCVGLTEPPIGKWYCATCSANMKNQNRK
ncbi:hypothetical protein BCR41DRAFT_360284 [Lobosporangium transversale]|uniref:Chromatin modification-related protein n=1 Tax=Lobosporangium transversale TaxID=64571 RepID=A0A1Y2GH10_9FUNG|nr:hypothetical protein BCR41DRAFT_360284 [Lobosporangium transversale]ORZ07267.1 hypothetical protein BCR41DRAFT_360284 [Lobosporangium transversale]|eukprot:XP_021877930.1 hypothetical protein BCR41DRAFT_360284 [Lobosporangium transversale]